MTRCASIPLAARVHPPVASHYPELEPMHLGGREFVNVTDTHNGLLQAFVNPARAGRWRVPVFDDDSGGSHQQP